MRTQALATLCLSLLALALSLPGPAIALAAIAPHVSYESLPFSNGYAAGVYDTGKRRLDVFLPHLYQAWDEQTTTPNLLYDAYFGVRVDGAGQWLTEVAPSAVEYLPGTGVLRIIAHTDSLKITTWLFAPMDVSAPALAAIAKVEVSDGAPHAVSLYSLLNFHVGGTTAEPGPANETAMWDAKDQLTKEEGTASGHAMLTLPFPAPAHRSVSPDNAYALLTAGKDLTDLGASGVMDDVIVGYQFDAEGGTLAPGQALWGGVLMAYGDAARPLALGWREGGTPEALLQAELDGWAAWQALTVLPDSPPVTLDPKRKALLHQSLAMLRMAQVREPNTPLGKPHGQVLASMPPGIWNIAWVRDGAYSIRALAKTGHTDEARWALDFILGGDAGDYADLVGHDYAVSVCRYYGNGHEWSDGGETAAGPNVEFDDFGLTLWAAAALFDATGDAEWLSERWPTLRDGVADVLVALQNPVTGLLPADSSIWEHHWNGHQKQFAYTQVTAARGLCDASWLAAQLGDTERADTYAKAAHSLRKAIVSEFVLPGGALAGNLEEIPAGKAVDASAVEALLMGVVPPEGPVGAATLALFDDVLIAPSGHGYKRNDDLDWYDEQEWVFIDLRVALAMRLAGMASKSDALLSWVVEQSTLNYGLVAELYEEVTADYEGAVPMAGYGAGAYILTVLTAEAEDMSRCPLPVEPPVDQGGADAGGADAGVADAGGADAGGADAAGADAAGADAAGADAGTMDAAVDTSGPLTPDTGPGDTSVPSDSQDAQAPTGQDAAPSTDATSPAADARGDTTGAADTTNESDTTPTTDAGPPPASGSSGGCAAGAHPPTGWALLLLAAVLCRRRRATA